MAQPPFMPPSSMRRYSQLAPPRHDPLWITLWTSPWILGRPACSCLAAFAEKMQQHGKISINQ